ncbi:hypothetical protein SKAU_G00021050 [Synaphobranchus kaupii]|uniref:HTH psq-type domain-containing protein n=1 Tax=Synaphobranchus kaupii TaxID=118154 RepID=A0A9Q1JED6_SYNKA|nr:hypothetical protein SKAU_G00021050 [Synaphobranchus kaupii]
MTAAMEDCERGMPVRKAARIHQVPRQTLQDRVSGRVVHGSRSGGPTMLSPEDENSLVQYCLYCAPRGFPLTHRVLAAFATALRRKRHPGGEYPKTGKDVVEKFQSQVLTPATPLQAPPQHHPFPLQLHSRPPARPPAQPPAAYTGSLPLRSIPRWQRV